VKTIIVLNSDDTTVNLRILSVTYISGEIPIHNYVCFSEKYVV